MVNQWFTGWWLSPTPLKNMSSSIGMMTFPSLLVNSSGEIPLVIYPLDDFMDNFMMKMANSMMKMVQNMRPIF